MLLGPATADAHSADPRVSPRDSKNKPRRWNHLLLVFITQSSACSALYFKQNFRTFCRSNPLTLPKENVPSGVALAASSLLRCAFLRWRPAADKPQRQISSLSPLPANARR